ncbi:MAG: acylphosphatase [Pseudomonadota bacterium]
MKVTRHLSIRGRVQGVWYRESLRQEAERLAVAGWVRNRLDGSVEALIQGEAGRVDTLTAWCRLGPPQAWVEEVTVEDAEGEFIGFEKRPTA